MDFPETRKWMEKLNEAGDKVRTANMLTAQAAGAEFVREVTVCLFDLDRRMRELEARANAGG